MTSTELELQEKQQLEDADEPTYDGAYYQPYTDINENGEAIVVSMDMPGVAKESIEIELEKNVLTVNGQVDFKPYQDMTPVYTEYNVGHYTRRFSIANTINKEAIAANVENGVLTITLPKLKEAAARKISVS